MSCAVRKPQTIRVTAPVREIKDAMLVPQQAVVEMQGNHLVSIVDANGVVTTLPVKLGPVEGPMQVIQGRLKAGDKVVVGGVEKVRPGMKVIQQPYQPPAPAASPAAKKPE